ncbi:MAG TPA: hypothetical protein VF679_02470 [Pedobacter sp.]
MSTIHDRINLRGKLDQWAKFTIEKFQKSLRKQGIGITDDLYKSFEKKITVDRDDMVALMIKFNFYGRLRDMGVGRGINAYERASNNSNRQGSRSGAKVSYVNRRPKKWYNKTKTAQLYRLREILSEDIGRETTAHIVDAFNQMGVQNIKI